MILKNMITTDTEFKKFQNLIQQRIGIKFPKEKRSLLESRLAGRIKKLGFTTFLQYYQYLENNEAPDEFEFFIDRITTHTTHFFREQNHFDFLISRGVTLINQRFNQPKIKIISVGSSTGEEMYSIAMILADLQDKNIIYDFEISAADISKKALLKAKEGVFDLKHKASIPHKYLKYFIIYEDSIAAKPVLKKHLRYFIINASNKNQKFPDSYHIVFCRNMLIYFTKEQQQVIINNISNILLPRGLFFSGHSESLIGLKHHFKKVIPAVYQGETHD